MNFKKKLFALCASLALSCATSAAVVTYEYAGKVTSDDANRGWVSFTGQIGFDSTLSDQDADNSIGDYKMSSWPFGMNVIFKDGNGQLKDFSLNNFFDILVGDNIPGLGASDQFGALARNAGQTESLGFMLYDTTQGVFQSDALPLPINGLTLAPFDVTNFTFSAGGHTVRGELTSLACVAGCAAVPPASVPEPASLALMVAGLLAAATALRRGRAA